MDEIKTQVIEVGSQFETQAVNAIVGGFGFASAIAWMDFTRSVIGTFVQGGKSSPRALATTAAFTTLLSIIVYMIAQRVSKKVSAPGAPTYALTR